ncbi:MAG: hypothetical protein AAF221_13105 [Pseudomonadota bacterium]
MTSDEEIRYYWRLRWLSSIQAFCDTEVQAKCWLNPEERNPHYSFIECMCCYFDDAFMSEEDVFERRVARQHMTNEEVDAVAQFHSMAEAYQSPNNDDYDVRAILSDHKWHEVVKAAQNVAQKLLKLLKTPEEKDALTLPLQWSELEKGGWEAEFPRSP